MSSTDDLSTEADRILYRACQEVARAVLSGNGGTSADLVDTLTRKYLARAMDYQDYVRGRREHDEVIEHAVRYIARVHAIPPCGTDAAWFGSTLRALMEVAVPNGSLDEEAARLLPCLQEGINEALASVPVPREDTRLSSENASELTRMQAAGLEHGVVSELLDLVERLHHGDPIGKDERRLMTLASLAAPLVRYARAD